MVVSSFIPVINNGPMESSNPLALSYERDSKKKKEDKSKQSSASGNRTETKADSKQRPPKQTNIFANLFFGTLGVGILFAILAIVYESYRDKG